MPKGAVVEGRAATRAVQLREKIRRLEIDAAAIRDLRPERVLEVLELRDEVEDDIQSLHEENLDLRPERTRVKTVDNILMRRASDIERALGRLGGYERLRQEREPPEEHWWWYLDYFLGEQRRKRAIRFIAIVVGLAVLVIGGNYLLNRFFGLDPQEKEARAHLSMAEQHMVSGDYDQAAAEYQQAIEVSPDLAEAHVALGVLYEIQGDTEEAQESLARARDLIDEEADYYMVLARNYESVGRYEEALTAIERAIELEPDSAQAVLIRGGIHEAMEQPQLALTDYERAASLAQEEGQDALYVLARMRMAMLLQRGAGAPGVGGMPGGF